MIIFSKSLLKKKKKKDVTLLHTNGGKKYNYHVYKPMVQVVVYDACC